MTLHRATFRALAVATLRAQLPLGTPILVGQQWPLGEFRLPAVLVDVRREAYRAAGRAGGEPRFQATAQLVVRAREVVEVDPTAAPSSILTSQYGAEHGPLCEAVLDLWIERIRDALLEQADFVTLFDAIDGVTIDTQVATEESLIAEAGLTFDLTWHEVFQPRIPDNFTTANIRVDAIEPADLAGTYPSVPGFPDAADAPRESGPDGRAEAGLVITLPNP